MDNTQIFALLFVLAWAGAIFWLGYYFGQKDGKAKAEVISQDLADQANEDLTRKLNDARTLNRRLMEHFELVQARLLITTPSQPPVTQPTLHTGKAA